jgi:hypothetical protein
MEHLIPISSTRARGRRNTAHDTAVWPEVDEARQDVGEIGLWIDAVEPAGLNEARNNCPVLGGVIMAGEEAVLSGQELSLISCMGERLNITLPWP